LPIEFLRLSKDGRLTLVIDDRGKTKPVRVLWALMAADKLLEAKNSLKEREGTSPANIHHVLLEDAFVKDQNKLVIQQWLKEKNLDAAIWTGLSFDNTTSNQFKGKRPTSKKVVDYLHSLKGSKRLHAMKYIENAPRQIDTKYRQDIESELNWTQK
jgi:hypothetical protein